MASETVATVGHNAELKVWGGCVLQQTYVLIIFFPVLLRSRVSSIFSFNFSFYGKMCMSVLRVYFSTSVYMSVYVCALSTFLGGQEKESKLTVASAKR